MKAGTIVRLNSGGPDMVSDGVIDKDDIEHYAWFHPDTVNIIKPTKD